MSLATAAATLSDCSFESPGFLRGEVVPEINGQLIKYSEVWCCKSHTGWSTSDGKLHQCLEREAEPGDELVVKRLTQGQIVAVRRLSACSPQTADPKGGLPVTPLDSADQPAYGEQLRLRPGNPRRCITPTTPGSRPV